MSKRLAIGALGKGEEPRLPTGDPKIGSSFRITLRMTVK